MDCRQQSGLLLEDLKGNSLSYRFLYAINTETKLTENQKYLH